jgi:hypothetical protein
MKNQADLLQKLIASLRADVDLANSRLSVGYYYSSLPLAVTDAVFSIGVRYETVVNAVHHLARRAGWAVYRPHGSPYLPAEQQHTMSELLGEFPKVAHAIEIFGNRGYANPAAAHPTLKAILVQRVASVLVANGIETFNDFAAFPNPSTLDGTLRALPSMSSGVVVFYLRMLCGYETEIKSDRHIHAFIRAASGESTLVLSNAEAVSLMQEAARSLAAEDGLRHVTPRLLDHAVWSVQRQVRGQKPKQALAPATLLTPPVGASDRGSGGHSGFRGVMSINDFWPFFVKSGVTPSGLEFSVDEQERLHIISPRSKNKNYKIGKVTVAKYLTQAHEVRFRRDHGWFCNVYDLALGQFV